MTKIHQEALEENLSNLHNQSFKANKVLLLTLQCFSKKEVIKEMVTVFQG
jgi:hypothetical protein